MGDEFFARLCQPILTVPIDAMSTKTYQLNVHDLKAAKCHAAKAYDASKQALLLRKLFVIVKQHFHDTVQDGLTKDYLQYAAISCCCDKC